MTQDAINLLLTSSWSPSIIALAAGLVVGLVHFASLLRNAALYMEHGRVGGAILLQLARMSLLVLSLSAAAWLGVGPLLATALGVLIARAAVMSRFGRTL